MIVHLPYLLLAAVLLWLPRSWMRLGAAYLKRRRRHGSRQHEPWREREPGDPRLNIRDEITKFRNYIDLLRGAAGSLAFAGGMAIPASLTVAANAPRSAYWQVMGIRAVILLVGLLLQTVHIERGKLSFYPAVFYLAGISVGLCDIRGAAFAFVLVWAVSPVFGGAQSFLVVYSILLVVFGHFFAGSGDVAALLAGGLAFLPVLLSLLTNRPLTVFTRKASRAEGA